MKYYYYATCTATVEFDDKELDSDRTAVITGSSFGALAVFLAIVLVIAVGAVCIKKGMYSHQWVLDI